MRGPEKFETCNIVQSYESPANIYATSSHEISNSRFGKMSVSFFTQFVQVTLHELEDKKELIVLSNNFFEFHDVWVIQFF